MKTEINKEVFEELLKLAEEVARFNVEYDKEIFFSHSPHVKAFDFYVFANPIIFDYTIYYSDNLSSMSLEKIANIRENMEKLKNK